MYGNRLIIEINDEIANNIFTFYVNYSIISLSHNY